MRRLCLGTSFPECTLLHNDEKLVRDSILSIAQGPNDASDISCGSVIACRRGAFTMY